MQVWTTPMSFQMGAVSGLQNEPKSFWNFWIVTKRVTRWVHNFLTLAASAS